MQQYKMFELSFQGNEPEASLAAINLEAVFKVNGVEKKVKGFYAGEGVYKVRFLPEEPGNYTWEVRGCVEASGDEVCIKAEGSADGQGIVRATGTHFVHADGTAFLPFGTTIYALAHQNEALIEQTYETLKKAPFNKVRHCVFPKHYDYNNNEPELFAFEKDSDGHWDMNHPNFIFWNNLENIIYKLAEMGIQSDLILFHPYDVGHWGFDELSMEQVRIYLDYLLRRFSAIPEIWWSMANEYDIVFKRTIEEWYEIENFIADNDPYNHLLSNHNCLKLYDFSRKNISHSCVQTTQLEKAGIWLEEYKKPLVYDECCYEGDLPWSWGDISGFEMVNRFWCACIQGAYCTHGEVFLSEDEVLWWSKGGILKGESPSRIAFLRAIMEELPGPLEHWKVDPLDMLDPELREKLKNSPFAELRKAMSEGERESLFLKECEYRGHCGDRVYMQYFARHCVGKTTWKLPENRTYDVEVIDVWNMTREKVLMGVNGVFDIKLPGREGIAILAK